MLEAWNFPVPEADVPEPPVVWERWAGEIEKYQLEGVVFVTGTGSELFPTSARTTRMRWL